jgi:hypothetical protein
MSKSAINATLDLPTNYSDLATLYSGAASSILFKGIVSFPSDNAANAYIQNTKVPATTGYDVTAAVGTYHEYSAVDLSTLKVKGTSGDKVVLVGEGLELQANWPSQLV